jgi:glycogen operon protein
MRNMLATLLLSQGTPMLLAGDEFARTQNGNNNVYAQDNPISWVDWEIPERSREQIAFVQKLTKLREKYPILRRSRFLTGEYVADLGVKDVTWISAGGGEMEEQEWADTNTRCFGMLVDGRAQPTGIHKLGEDATLLIVFNAYYDVVNFTLPQITGGDVWSLLIDTNLPAYEEEREFSSGDVYGVTGRSLLLFRLNAGG